MSDTLSDDAWPGSGDRFPINQLSLDDLHESFVEDLEQKLRSAERQLARAEHVILVAGDVLTDSERREARASVDTAAERVIKLESDLDRARGRQVSFELRH